MRSTVAYLQIFEKLPRSIFEGVYLVCKMWKVSKTDPEINGFHLKAVKPASKLKLWFFFWEITWFWNKATAFRFLQWAAWCWWNLNEKHQGVQVNRSPRVNLKIGRGCGYLRVLCVCACVRQSDAAALPTADANTISCGMFVFLLITHQTLTC